MTSVSDAELSAHARQVARSSKNDFDDVDTFVEGVFRAVRTTLQNPSLLRLNKDALMCLLLVAIETNRLHVERLQQEVARTDLAGTDPYLVGCKEALTNNRASLEMLLSAAEQLEDDSFLRSLQDQTNTEGKHDDR